MSDNHDNSVNQRYPQIFINFAGITSLKRCVFGRAAFSVLESGVSQAVSKNMTCEKYGLTAQNNTVYVVIN